MIVSALRRLSSVLSLLFSVTAFGAGADLPWTTYEAEAMKTTGTVLGPKYEPYMVETESSGEQCVKLAATGDYLEFTAAAAANTLVVRFSQADSPDGSGTSAKLGLSVNGQLVRTLELNSLYGNYPFTTSFAASGRFFTRSSSEKFLRRAAREESPAGREGRGSPAEALGR